MTKTHGGLLALALSTLVAASAGQQPGPITDLRTKPEGTQVTLLWTAPAGLPTEHFRNDCTYDIRLSTTAPAGDLDAWWNAATPWSAQPHPKASGTAESIVITGIDPTVATYFVIQTYYLDTKPDVEVEYWSELSNVATSLPQIPDAPTALQQVRRDGTTIAPGGLVTQTSLAVQATVTDPIGKDCRLEVEFRSGSSPFDGSGLLASGMMASGAVITIPIDGLVPAMTYRWRARAVNVHDLASGWIEFGAGAADVDLATPVIESPTITSLRQALAGATIGVGERVIGAQPEFEASIHQDYGIPVRLEIEVRALEQSFNGIATSTGLALPGGGVGVVTQEIPEGLHHWQARAVDLEWGVASAWVSFGGNGEGAADFELQAGGSTGSGLCSESAGVGASWLAFVVVIVAAGFARYA